ncbi:replication-relaxation family protein [Longispora sp. K20-0274]|uniref:replication-relaxation family protein n=1 Tax=Longispora sp. K20-0274 TaxID=3088255 RepID=UPI00399B01D8
MSTRHTSLNRYSIFDYTRLIAPRDQLLLDLLAEHHVLSTRQIAVLVYPSLRRARDRLAVLHRAEVLSRHAWTRATGGITEYLYSLGPLGARLRPNVSFGFDRRRRVSPRDHLEHMTRLVSGPTLAHTVGANQFFVDLSARARTLAGCALTRWWSERHATFVFGRSGIHPDGHGVWRCGGKTVGFFLEHDNGTENHARVVSKFAAYRELAEHGPTYPVLLWVPSPSRRDNLLASLTGVGVPVAVAVHGGDPAARVWYLAGIGGPYHLHDLPSDHGPDSANARGRIRR